MTKHYVEFFYPGSFVPETSTKEVKSRDVAPKMPERAYAYRFFDMEEIEMNGETLRGKRKNVSPMHYFGEDLTAEEALKTANSIARSNIEVNGYTRLVRTRFGQLFPIKKEDVVIR